MINKNKALSLNLKRILPRRIFNILIYSGKNKNGRATSGVGILIHESFERDIKDIRYINDRILQITLALMEKKAIHIISVYAPDMSKSQEEKDNFYYELQNTLDPISKKDEIIILGYLNAYHTWNQEQVQ